VTTADLSQPWEADRLLKEGDEEWGDLKPLRRNLDLGGLVWDGKALTRRAAPCRPT
jgi:hypothetical protein